MFYRFKILIISLINIFFLLLFGCDNEIEYKSCDTRPLPLKSEFIYLPTFDEELTTFPDFKRTCTNNNTSVFDNRFNPYLGGTESVDVVVEIFASFRCPACARFHNTIKKIWSENEKIQKKTRIYFHYYTFSGQELYHAAAIAAGMQDMQHYHSMADFFYRNVSTYIAQEDIREFAQFLDLDLEIFNTAINPQTEQGKEVYTFLQNDITQAKQGCIGATPTVYICGQMLYNYNDLKDAILSHLK